MTEVVLPYPPSANRYWRVVNGHPVKSREARQYGAAVRRLLDMVAVPITVGDVAITVSIYRPARRGDLDNTLKVLLDSLCGLAYRDDSQIVEILARRYEDARNPRAVVSWRTACYSDSSQVEP